MSIENSPLVSPASDADPTADSGSVISLRVPKRSDAVGVYDLVDRCKPLDLNSFYAYLLIIEHHGGTCVVAEKDGRTVGFISAYPKPGDGGKLFVWQVAVDSSTRGEGLGRRMLRELVGRPACREVRFIETTVTPSNLASRGMFQSFARSMDAACEEEEFFTAGDFGARGHEPERLMRIGPFRAPNTDEQKG